MQADLMRLKKTVSNHTGKLEDVISHLLAVETMLDGMRREIRENGKREALTFRKRDIGGEEDGV
jgi:hypothetical protein